MQGSQQESKFMPSAIVFLAAGGGAVPFAREDGGEAAAAAGIRDRTHVRPPVDDGQQ
jgi:hypothetical protein